MIKPSGVPSSSSRVIHSIHCAPLPEHGVRHAATLAKEPFDGISSEPEISRLRRRQPPRESESMMRSSLSVASKAPLMFVPLEW